MRNPTSFRPALSRAALLAAILLLPAASRSAEGVDLKVYGFLNAQLEGAQAMGGATPYRGRGRVSDGNSRLGFTGTVAITDELQGVWQLEGGLGNFEQGGLSDRGVFATLESRNTFVGLAHPGVGRLVFGYSDSAYRTLVGSAGAFGGNLGLTRTGLDVWNNTSAQGSGNTDSVFSRGEARFANSLHFDSVKLFGFQVAASYSFDEAAAQSRLRDRYCAGLTYEFGPLKLGVGYDHQSNSGVDQLALFTGLPFAVGAADGASTSFVKGVVGLQLEDTLTSLSLGFEHARYGYSSLVSPSVGTLLREGTMTQNGAMISVAQGLTHGVVLMAAYGRLLGLDGALVGAPADYEAWQLSVGAKYSIGETFTSYVYYTAIQNAPRQNANLGQSPLYSNARGTSEAYLAPGSDPRTFGVGLVTRF